ncbi:hypothetical protein SODALDRAFT_326490 [Sodiomyces alkalinus F11]|uniref:CENP-V/GFA domain-containing protein n=1 Tax=Sodiomyces alkalinus (strain CBS 110278 / VKM F-3762 / F11) TaxID=1314773 RepID=A0A3N2Q6B7_SODAK|nr:hypothetical protein SODALDRAFT_326490 [Sodiomyces alkalinus F11]ROT42311.1 hypothetical protein SODALDRAFT_326490 [Sodiomyces alkalinus F11]
MDARCQCGQIAFKTPLPKPLALYICHCSSCRRQASSAFGTSAIFPRFRLPNMDLLSVYARPTASGHTLYCYFCRNCGTRLIHATPSKDVVSVKGGCIEGLDWSKAVHIWTKSAMVPIPEGSETHSEDNTSSSFRSASTSTSSSAGSPEAHYRETQEMLDQPNDEPAPSSEADRAGGPVVGACELSG